MSDRETSIGPRVLAWLRFFRIVNVPTLPGDTFVGASVAFFCRVAQPSPVPVVWAACAGIAAYLFGLADNDLVGASTDRNRPIPDGLIGLGAARVARSLCWTAVVACGLAGGFGPLWWWAMAALLVCIVAYNRTKRSVLMGLCRGLNVVCGAAAVCGVPEAAGAMWPVLIPASVWTAYIASVTAFSEGEELSPSRRRTVGILIGALVYLQLVALTAMTMLSPVPAQKRLLVAGAVMLVVLRFSKNLLPKVSAS